MDLNKPETQDATRSGELVGELQFAMALQAVATPNAIKKSITHDPDAAFQPWTRYRVLSLSCYHADELELGRRKDRTFVDEFNIYPKLLTFYSHSVGPLESINHLSALVLVASTRRGSQNQGKSDG